MTIQIGNHKVGEDEPVYFIADIASNHNGDLIHAKELIYACSESKVNAVKMQNFTAETIVSDYGFKSLVNVKSHQSSWKKSVFSSYKDASIPFEWTLELKELSESLGMDYFTSPYSLELTRAVAPFVSAFKLGSGDITWHDQIKLMSSYKKPILIATGASDLSEVNSAMQVVKKSNSEVILMQCNTDYTARRDEQISITKQRLSNINLKVLQTYSNIWPGIPLGLSDHTHGDLTVLAATALYGCSAVEKHFTLDSSKEGQDHAFSMEPNEWLSMVENVEILRNNISSDDSFDVKKSIVRDLSKQGDYVDLVVGNGVKSVQDNEENTVIVQRRAIRAKRRLTAGEIIKENDLDYLRPCPKNALPPCDKELVLGKVLLCDIPRGDYISASSLQKDD